MIPSTNLKLYIPKWALTWNLCSIAIHSQKKTCLSMGWHHLILQQTVYFITYTHTLYIFINQRILSQQTGIREVLLSWKAYSLPNWSWPNRYLVKLRIRDFLWPIWLTQIEINISDILYTRLAVIPFTQLIIKFMRDLTEEKNHNFSL